MAFYEGHTMENLEVEVQQENYANCPYEILEYLK